MPFALACLALAASAHAAEPMGRLFFSPAERAALDEARRKPEPVVVIPPAPPPPPPEIVTINGVVRRSDGTTTVWINDRPVTDSRAATGVVLTPPKRNDAARVGLRVPQVGRSVEIAVGQQLDVTSGRVTERYAIRERAPETGAGPESGAVERPPETRPATRRTSRERELLRDILRELDPAPPAPPASPAPADGAVQTPSQ